MDHGRPKFNRNSSCSGLLRFHPQTDATPSLTGLSPSAAGFPNTIQLTLRLVTARENCNPLLDDPVTPPYATLAGLHVNGLGYSPFAHHYSGYLFDFFYVRLLRCFTSPTSPPQLAGLRPTPEGLPHSDTPGSKVACASPGLFAACRVLLRCRMPWHPPCALLSLLSSTALPSILLSSYTGKLQTNHKGIPQTRARVRHFLIRVVILQDIRLSDTLQQTLSP